MRFQTNLICETNLICKTNLDQELCNFVSRLILQFTYYISSGYKAGFNDQGHRKQCKVGGEPLGHLFH